MSLRKYVPTAARKTAFHIRFLKGFYNFKQDIKKFFFFKIMIRTQYALACRHRIQPDKVVFLEITADELTNSDRVLFNALMARYDLDVHVHFLQRGTVKKDELYRRQQAFLKDAATAKYLIYNDSYNFTGALKKRKGQHIMNLWHGAGAFKRFGFSISDKKFGMTAAEMRKFPLHPRYDIVTVSAPEVRWAYIEAMGKEKDPEEIQALGISRTDIFYDPDFIEKARRHLYSVFPEAEGKKVILYAPTFRGHVNHAESPDMLNIRAFQETLGESYVLLINNHPFVKKAPAVPYECRDFAVDLTGFMPIDELIAVTDICISDYSSMIFEYSLFEKPMIFYAYDLANYFDWRGFYYDYQELTPGPVCFTNRDMLDYITHIDERFDKKKVHDFRMKFMSSCDGHATDRIISAFFGAEIEPYRREKELPGDYTDIPDSSRPFYGYTNLMQFMNRVEREFAPAYARAAGSPVVPGRIALVADEYCDDAVFHSIRKGLRSHPERYPGLTILDDFSKTDLSLKEYAGEIGRAAYILSAGEPYLLRTVTVRPETKMLQVSPEIFSAFPAWNRTKERRIRYWRYDCEHFPIHSRYDGILTSVAQDRDSSDEMISSNYTLKPEGEVLPLGSLYADLMTDRGFRQHAVSQTEALIPESAGKKKIVFLCIPRPGLGDMLSALLRNMYEAFADQYICIVRTSDPELIPEYMQGFAISPALQREKNLEFFAEQGEEIEDDDPRIRRISDARLLAAADLVISDYDTKTFVYLATGRKLLLYTPDVQRVTESREALFDYEAAFRSMLAKDPPELIRKISMDDAVYRKETGGIREMILGGQKGNTADRVLQEIKA